MAIKNSGRLALAGVVTALALVFMLLTAVIPPSTVALAAAAGLCGIPVVMEIGRAKALLHYAAVSILSILLVPAIGGKILYVGFFGYYTIFKAWVENKRLSPKWEWIIKISLFLLLSVAGCLLLVRLPWAEKLPFITGDFLTALAFLFCAVIATAVLIVYDRCITGLVSLYHVRLRPRLRRLFRF